MAAEKIGKDSKKRWFRKSNSNDITDENLQLANRARTTSEELRELAHGSLKEINVGSNLQNTRSGVEAQLREYAGEALQGAFQARSNWDESRNSGFRKIGSTLQRFATGLAKVLGAYSSIVEAVENMGGPYAEAGYQAISILLIVAVNKSKNDLFITRELEEIANCFPRIDLLGNLYPDETIERYILEVHSGVILFASDATQYFLSASMTMKDRFGKALVPKEKAVKGRIEEIKRSLAELNAWSTVFMHVRTQELVDGKNQLLEDNHQLQEKINDLQIKLKGLETRDLERRKREQSDDLEALRLSLGRPDEKINTNLKDCLRNQDMFFPSSKHRGKSCVKYLQMSLDLLEREKNYRSWADSQHGCLLILGGKTRPEGQLAPSGFSWLSPAATDVAATLQNREEVVGFFSCYPNSWLSSEQTQSERELMAGLVFQLLRAESTTLIDDLQRQQAALNVESWVRKRHAETFDAIMSATIDIFRKASKRGWIWLIIDRAERCSSGLHRLLVWLHKVVMDPQCRIKVLVVFDPVESDMSEHDWQEYFEVSEGHVYTKIGWNQDKMGSEKISLREPPMIES